MKVQYANPGRKPAGKNAKKGNNHHLSLRLLAAVAIFLGVFGAKSWLPGASAPVVAMLQGTLSANTDLKAVTQAVGQAAAGDRDFTAVFRSLFLTEEEPGRPSVHSEHLQAESRFLSMAHSDQELLQHYLPGDSAAGSWLNPAGTGGKDTEA